MDRKSPVGTLRANLVVLLWLLAAVFMQNRILSHPKRDGASPPVALVAAGSVQR